MKGTLQKASLKYHTKSEKRHGFYMVLEYILAWSFIFPPPHSAQESIFHLSMAPFHTFVLDWSLVDCSGPWVCSPDAK
jgi:hypothetical protein